MMGTLGKSDSSQHQFSSSMVSGLDESSLDSSFDIHDPCHGQQQLIQDLEGLINNEETADVIFLMGDQETPFFLHRLLLWSRCQNFKKYGLQFWGHKSSKGMLNFKYPHYQPSVFARVQRYMYTGQFHAEDSSVFSTLTIATELGLPDLQKICESFISSRLDADNACLFLAGALRMESKDLENDPIAGTFTETCVKYISRNAVKCFSSESWYKLPQAALIRILQSEELCLEEEEVWRAVLTWAKFKADIPSNLLPLHWSEVQRERAAQFLTGLIDHVKVLLIDSKVFAEEVEPTGVVPMEISLQRYRCAAVPNDMNNQSFDDERLKPRVHVTLFKDTLILCDENTHFQKLLNQWSNTPNQRWRLLFRASQKNFSAEEFHRACDGFSPTFTIIKGIKHCVSGGYSDVPWTSNTLPRGRFIPSNRYGPTFGAGSDLCIADRCNTGMQSYSNFPHTYGKENSPQSVLMGDYYFNVTEYEVFTTVNSVHVHHSDHVR